MDSPSVSGLQTTKSIPAGVGPRLVFVRIRRRCGIPGTASSGVMTRAFAGAAEARQVVGVARGRPGGMEGGEGAHPAGHLLGGLVEREEQHATGRASRR